MKIFLLFVFSCISIYPQISPGDLTIAHSQYEGLSNCTKCHVIGEQVSNHNCLSCHKEIKTLLDAGRGYHSSSEVKGKNCWNCHSEHHGRNFKIVKFNSKGFIHTKTGYDLTGAHFKAECKDCHQAKNISDAELRKKKNTYLGLNQNCKSCHEDYHQGTLSDNCSSCHSTFSFRPAEKFNHDNTKFKLTGAHLNTGCIKCHQKEKRNGKDFQKFKGLNFSQCISCHRDVHQGKFGNECQKCHVTVSFHNINQSVFDHSKTNFPLIGKHKSVKCNDCHKTSLTSKPKHDKCLDCHKDYHAGEFTLNNIQKDCNSCHSEEGFKPSKFSIADHQKTEFQLTGGHLAVPCYNCHYKETKWKFKNIGLKCIDCHKNIHGNELTAEFLPENNCLECHDVEKWATIRFDHNKTQFKLLGKHLEQTCSACHYKNRKDFIFASLNTGCTACHKDVHFGQFAEGEANNCIRCHAFNSWKPEVFNHNKTRFSLTGAHAKLSCLACHKKTEVNGNSFIQYKLKDFRCAACHS